MANATMIETVDIERNANMKVDVINGRDSFNITELNTGIIIICFGLLFLQTHMINQMIAICLSAYGVLACLTEMPKLFRVIFKRY